MATKINRLWLLAILVAMAPPARAGWPWESWLGLKAKPPALVVADPTPGSKKTFSRQSQDLQELVAKIAADANGTVSGPCLVVVTHGWREKSDWHKDMALAIRDKVGAGPWICAWYDWRGQAKKSSAVETTLSARQVYGPSLGKDILSISTKWRHIHLIGHSSGSWLASEAARTVAQQTKTSVHLTFLDAYIPPFWNQAELGSVTCQAPAVCWTDYYFSRDLASQLPQQPLSHALNVDLSAIDPRIKGPKFPCPWYQATVTGRFDEVPYKGRLLFTRVGEIEYGFARSLEAGTANWEYSRKLLGGNEPVMLIAK